MTSPSGSALHIYVTRILEELSADAARASTVDILVHALKTFLRNVAYDSRSYAEHGKRSSCNARDVQLALHGYGITVTQLHDFLTLYKDQPPLMVFPPDLVYSSITHVESHLVAARDTSNTATTSSSSSSISSSTAADALPSYLPPKPPAETYTLTKNLDNGASVPPSVKSANIRHVVAALDELDSALAARMSTSSAAGAAGAGAGAASAGERVGKHVLGTNLYEQIVHVTRRSDHTVRDADVTDAPPSTILTRVPLGYAPASDRHEKSVLKRVVDEEVEQGTKDASNPKARKLAKYAEVMGSSKMLIAGRDTGGAKPDFARDGASASGAAGSAMKDENA